MQSSRCSTGRGECESFAQSERASDYAWAMKTFMVTAVLVCLSAGWAVGAQAQGTVREREPAYLRNAGRSPLAQPGEVFRKPIAYKRLAPEVAVVVPPVPASGVVPWSEASKYVGGGPITVEGTIVDTYQVRDVVCRLNFTKDFRGKFYVALFTSATEQMSVPPAEYFKGKTIRVTGLVTMFKDQPTLEVRDAKQLEVVE